MNLASDEDARDMIVAKDGHLGAPIVQIRGVIYLWLRSGKKMESLLK